MLFEYLEWWERKIFTNLILISLDWVKISRQNRNTIPSDFQIPRRSVNEFALNRLETFRNWSDFTVATLCLWRWKVVVIHKKFYKSPRNGLCVHPNKINDLIKIYAWAALNGRSFGVHSAGSYHKILWSLLRISLGTTKFTIKQK